MISKLFLLLPILVHAPVAPEIRSALSRNIQCINFPLFRYELNQILHLLDKKPICNASYQKVRNILTGPDPENISSNSLIGVINKKIQEYMDPNLIEDICAFMLCIDDVFHMYNSDFYYKLWASKFPGDDRHVVRESLKIIRDDLQQRFLQQQPNDEVLCNGLPYFKEYFVNIAFREMYFNLSNHKD